jgi:phosphatidylinositol glycan class B
VGLAGQAGVRNHCTIGDSAAVPMLQYKRQLVALRRLPALRTLTRRGLVDKGTRGYSMDSSAPVGSLSWIARSPSPLAAFTRACLGVSLALHLTAAIFSGAFHHADEHFQILEFANARLGLSPASELPWEYRARMRPWFQPAVALVVVDLMRGVGINSPFAWATGLRLISAVLGWCALAALCCCVFGWLRSERLQRYTILALSTLWFLPYLHARFSSESWSGSLFFLGFLPLVLAVQRDEHDIRPATVFGCGMAMGLAFEARYQAALLIAGALVWCLRYTRLSRSAWLSLCGGGVLAVAVCTALDRSGYGMWTLAPLNYFHVNVVRNVSAKFGTHPVWMHALWISLLPPPPLGLLFLVGMAATWVAKPRFSLTWCTLPFVVVQSLVAHKEPRFLYPIFLTFPVFLAMAWQALEPRVALKGKIVHAMKMLLVLYVIANAVLAAIVIFLPARRIITIYSEVYERGLTELYWVDHDPYTAGIVSLHFYQSGLKVIRVATYDELARLLAEKAAPVWLFRSGLGLPPAAAALEGHCRAEWQSTPASRRDRWFRWIDALEGRTVFPDDGIRLATARSLFRCEPAGGGGANLSGRR